MIKKLGRIVVCVLLGTIASSQSYANEAYTEWLPNVQIKTEVYQQLTNSQPLTRPLFLKAQDMTYESIAEHVQSHYAANKVVDEGEANYDKGHILTVSTSNGDFRVTEERFFDAISVAFERESQNSIIYEISSEARRMAVVNNQLVERLSFATPSEAIEQVKAFQATIGVSTDNTEYEVYPLSEQNLLDFEAHYNEHGAEDIDGEKIHYDYSDMYVVEAHRRIEGLNFLTHHQEIGNFESGTNVVGEGQGFLVTKQGVVFASVANYYPIDVTHSADMIEQHDQRLLDLLQQKFDNLIVTDTMFIDDVETIYAPYPIGQASAERRTMLFQPIWKVDVRVENGLYEANNPASSPFFDVSFYFSVKDHKEILN